MDDQQGYELELDVQHVRVREHGPGRVGRLPRGPAIKNKSLRIQQKRFKKIEFEMIKITGRSTGTATVRMMGAGATT